MRSRLALQARLFVPALLGLIVCLPANVMASTVMASVCQAMVAEVDPAGSCLNTNSCPILQTSDNTYSTLGWTDLSVGSAFDSSGNFYVTEWPQLGIPPSAVAEFGPSGGLIGNLPGFGAQADPASILFDSSGNMWVGLTGTGQIAQFDPTGTNQLYSFTVGLASTYQWISMDFESDHCTMLYTLGGDPNIHTFNICTGSAATVQGSDVTVTATNGGSVGTYSSVGAINFVAAGFQVGGQVMVTGCANPGNNGLKTIAAVAPGALSVFSPAATMVNENAGAFDTFSNPYFNAQALPYISSQTPGAGVLGQALRVLPSQVGTLPAGSVLVADYAEVAVLDNNGNQVGQYGVPNDGDLVALTLDPDGTSFWVGDGANGDVSRMDIATGQIITTFRVRLGEEPKPGGGGCPGVFGLSIGPTVPSLNFTWSMPPRFPGDPLSGVFYEINTPQSTQQLNPASWPINFTVVDPGSATGTLSCDPNATYTFSVNDVEGRPVVFTHTPGTCDWQGTFPSYPGKPGVDVGNGPVNYTVTLTKTNPSQQVSQTINPRDWLIVSIGDSVGSGEGAPDSPYSVTSRAVWQDGKGGFAPLIDDSSQCHRSAKAASAVAAAFVENKDPHTSVTFIHLACSGAGIYYGLLHPYYGLYNNTNMPYAASQIDQLAALLGTARKGTQNRPIDALIINAGGNDIGFGSASRLCSLPPKVLLKGLLGTVSNSLVPVPEYPMLQLATDCENDQNMQWQGSPSGGHYAQLPPGGQNLALAVAGQLQSQTPSGLPGLPTLYAKLKTALSQFTFSTTATGQGPVYLVEYYDPLFDSTGSECMSIPSGLPGFASTAWNSTEIDWAEVSVVQQLDAQVDAGAEANGWQLVGGVANLFRYGTTPPGTFPPLPFGGHGMCAGQPWVNTAGDSFDIEGDGGAGLAAEDYYGTGHPNATGYAFIGRLELAMLHNDLYKTDGSPRDDATPNSVSASTASGSSVAMSLPVGSSPMVSANVTFSSVGTAGQTSAVAGYTGPTPPSGMAFGGPQPSYLDISTTASYTGSISVSIDFDPSQFGSPTSVQLFHYENGSWQNVTNGTPSFSYSGVIGTVSGNVSSLSPFLIAEPATAAPPPPIVVFPTPQPTPAGPSGSQIAIAPQRLLFGSSSVGTASAPQNITVTNNGPVALHITGVGSGSPAFAETDNCVGTLRSHSSCTINVLFAPIKTGAQNALLQIADNAGSQGAYPQWVSLKGTGTASMNAVTAAPAAVSFGSQPVNTRSGLRTVSISNGQSTPLHISGISVAGQFVTASNTCGSTVKPNSGCFIAVMFAPTSSGDQNGTLTIANDATASPLTVALSGTAPSRGPTPTPVATPKPQVTPAPVPTSAPTAAPTRAASPTPVPTPSASSAAAALEVTPHRLGLGKQAMGSTASQQRVRDVILFNPKNRKQDSTIVVESIVAEGDFKIPAGVCLGPLASGKRCKLPVTFDPTAGGLRKGALTIESDAANGTQTVHLSGTGLQ